MPTSLPMGEESAMILRAQAALFEISIVFPNLICVWGANFAQRTWLPRQSGPKKPHRAGPSGLAYGGAIILA
jgi:hypothetical protein